MSQPPMKRHAGRALATFAVAALAGPAVGGLMVMAVLLGPQAVASLFHSPRSIGDAVGHLPELPGVVAAVLLFSYIFGGVQSLACGAILGWKVWRDGTFGYGHAALAALAVSAVGGVLFTAHAWYAGPDEITGRISISALLSLVSLASALVCRWILGRLLGLAPSGKDEINLETRERI